MMKFTDYVKQARPKPQPITSPIPVTVITGFLGSGKTTLLNRILNSNHSLRIAVMVNDFGAINIDSQLITNIQENIISLANGCICCTIQGSMVGAIEDLLAQVEEPPQYIIIEASGVADPAGIVRGLNYPQLRALVQVDSILALLDAEQFGSLSGQMARLAREQLSIADIIVINKTDLATAAQLANLKKNWLFPRARVIETSYGDVPLDLVLGLGQYDLDRCLGQSTTAVNIHTASQADAFHHGLAFTTWSWTSNKPLDLQHFRAALKQLPSTIFRGKGFVFLADKPEQRAVLHLVGSRQDLALDRPWGETIPRTQLVFIGDNDSINATALRELFAACEV